ncbi:hypothetical protein [Halomicrobium katesii]|uniref:hypothetical protein n=1 Tax=Halomicrobium katesii TaxID=437163 RepID=UPI000363C789|nr:hypothetical protein [Halomicrobium katesii]
MDTRAKIALLDGFLGVVQIIAALGLAETGTLVEHWWLVVATALGTVGFAIAGDRGYTPDDSTWGFTAVVVAVVAASLLAVFVVNPPVPTVAALQFGVGSGILTNRLLFGVVWPVPTSRIERFRDGIV